MCVVSIFFLFCLLLEHSSPLSESEDCIRRVTFLLQPRGEGSISDKSDVSIAVASLVRASEKLANETSTNWAEQNYKHL